MAGKVEKTADRAVRGLKKMLSRHGFTGIRSSSDQDVDLSVDRGKTRFAVAIIAPSAFRRLELRGRVADAVLRLRRAIGASRQKPLVAVWLPQVTRAALHELETYLSTYASEVGWLISDKSGRTEANVLGTRISEEGAEPEIDPVVRVPPESWRNPFSPVYQWVLKVLLLGGVDERYWGGPNGRHRGVTQIARAAGVAQPSVSRIIATLEHGGYVKRRGRQISIADPERLLADWAFAFAQSEGGRIYARLLYPHGDRGGSGLLQRLARMEAFAVGGHEACRMLGVSRSNVRALRIYAKQELGDALGELDLVQSDRKDALCELIHPRAERSIFGGTVDVNGVCVVDILQAYLDVHDSRARGREQAEHILSRVLRPHFEELGWR